MSARKGIPATEMVGKRYGRLTVIGLKPKSIRNGTRKPKDMGARCVCDCGQVVLTRPSSLRSGNTRSCGCLAAEKARTAWERGRGNAQS